MPFSTDAGRARGAVRALVFIFFACMYLATMGGHFYSIDEEVVLRLSDAMAARGAFDITPLEAMPTFAVAQGADGRWYTSKALGFALLATPVLPLSQMLARVVPSSWLPQAFLVPGGPRGGLLSARGMPAACIAHGLFAALNPIISAAICVILLELALTFGYPLRVAYGLTLLYGFGTMAWANAAHSNFAEPLLSLCTIGAVWCAVRARPSGEPGMVMAAAGFCGYAVLTKVTALVLAPLLLVYLRWSPSVNAEGPRETAAPRNRDVWMFCTVLVPFVALAALYNQARFGSPFESGYAVEGHAQGLPLSGAVAAHLMSLIFSWGKGLVFYAPSALCYVAAFPLLARRRPADCLLLGAVGLGFLFTTAAWYDWEGGLSWGPRLLLPMVALWTLPAGELVTATDGTSMRWRGALTVLCALGVVVQLSAAPVNWMEWYNDVDSRVRGGAVAVSPQVRYTDDPHVLADAVAKLVYFRFSLSPLVGMWQLWGRGNWDLFFFAQPAELQWRGPSWLSPVAGLLLLVTAGVSGASLWRRAGRPAHGGVATPSA